MRLFRARCLPLLCLVGVLVAPVPFLRPDRPDLPAGRRYAFLVGVSRYDAEGARELPYSENDIAALAEVLGARGYNPADVIRMTERVGALEPRYLPRLANIRREVRGLLGRCRPQDMVLVALTGHGTQFEGDPEQYFFPSDVDPRDARSFLSITEVYEDLARCAAGHKLLLVDACRADVLGLQPPRPPGRPGVGWNLRPRRPPPGRGIAAFFSCSQDEISFEHEDLGRSIFLHFVIEGLKGEAADADQRVTLPALQKYVTRRVPAYVRAKHEPCEQTPEWFGHWPPTVSVVRPHTVSPKRWLKGSNQIEN